MSKLSFGIKQGLQVEPSTLFNLRAVGQDPEARHSVYFGPRLPEIFEVMPHVYLCKTDRPRPCQCRWQHGSRAM